jgi:class 3 adenylate cyclase
MKESDRATKEDALKAGREALARSAWQEAFEQLSAADAGGDLRAEDLERLGEAAMWAWQPDECISAYERAFAKYLEAGNRQAAAQAARALIEELLWTQAGESVVAGWISRLTRLLNDEPECAAHGYLAYLKSHVHLGSGDTDEALALAQRAFELGCKFDDPDLQALGLNNQGVALVAKGAVGDGMALLNEAAAAAVAGELGTAASAAIYCNIVGTCRGLSDYGKASEWIDAAKRWCDRTAMSTYPGTCRVYRAEVMRLRGVWAEAESDARAACEDLRRYPNMAREAFYELGEIRLRIGDLKGAEQALRQAHEMGRDPQPALALVRLAQGQVESAAALIRRAVAEHDSDRLALARLLPAQVEITLAQEELDTARSAVEEMEAIAGTYGTTLLRATALCVRGMLQRAEGDPESALRNFRQGLRLWQEIDAPYDAARARVSAADSYRATGDEESARLELDSALSVFERLGADLDAGKVREQLDAEASRGGRAAAPARTTKTFMFSDIVNSTPLVEAIGDRAWDDLLNWHDKTLRSLFASHGGEEFKHGGDGFSVAFDSARSAVDCAIAIQSRLAEHRRNHGFALRVRIGLHASEVTRRGADYGGKGVHEAARIAALAGPEEIIASRQTAEAAGVPAGEPRAVALKGIAQPVEIVPIAWY